MRWSAPSGGRRPAAALALLLLALLLLPVVALAVSASPTTIGLGIRHPLFFPALWLSLRTSAVSLIVVLVTGTPLAWWLSTTRSRTARVAELLVDVPIVLPPAVLGVALLSAYGQRGLLGPLLDALGITLPFSSAAVVMAQVVVSAPFFVQAAAAAFRKVDTDLLVVAQTLGASPTEAFFRVAVPVALPGLLGGVALAWARSLGEFGATLLFAGNLSGKTQTMPLAIYTALESDVRAAVAIALVLAAVAAVLLMVLRGTPAFLRRRRAEALR